MINKTTLRDFYIPLGNLQFSITDPSSWLMWSRHDRSLVCGGHSSAGLIEAPVTGRFITFNEIEKRGQRPDQICRWFLYTFPSLHVFFFQGSGLLSIPVFCLKLFPMMSPGFGVPLVWKKWPCFSWYPPQKVQYQISTHTYPHPEKLRNLKVQKFGLFSSAA